MNIEREQFLINIPLSDILVDMIQGKKTSSYVYCIYASWPSVW